MVHDSFRLTAVVERSVKKVQLQYPDIKSYNSVDELLTDPDIELVVINTPNDTHFEFALKALRAGKHVLVEKPFTVNSSQAKQLFQEAKEYNRYILPYQNRRYDSDFLSVKDVIDSGRLGKLEEMHLRFDRFRENIGPKVFQETQIPGSGLLYNLGPHLLDAVISIFGKPLGWTKTLGHFRENTLVDDYVHIHLTYPEELQVYITTGLLIVDPQPAFILHGTKGSYVKQRTDIQEQQLMGGMSPDDPLFGLEEKGKEGILSTIAQDGTLLREKILPVRSSYLNVFDRVYQTIREGKPYPVTEDQIIQQLEILEG
jgi:predicted dehydrogenase